ncbi:hypothetical protein L596_002278 [Steinernema carpocapsae]|uniref:Protein sleepless n=1 Tax=Steinernema carpocapsae TaxID=34508 RepID=A0A4U8USQ5_STECR|nr:hypothetical protein L596_002278 [Steinernema carpocapsae]
MLPGVSEEGSPLERNPSWLSSEHTIESFPLVMMVTNKMLLFSFLMLIFVWPQTYGLKCHTCAGSDYIPKSFLKVLVRFNIANPPKHGDCRSQLQFCETDQFCVKNNVAYRIGFKGLRYNWNTYIKGCPNSGMPGMANVDSSINGSAAVGCTTTNGSSTAAGAVVQSHSFCNCRDRDFCNGSFSTSLAILPSCLLLVITRML